MLFYFVKKKLQNYSSDGPFSPFDYPAGSQKPFPVEDTTVILFQNAHPKYSQVARKLL